METLRKTPRALLVAICGLVLVASAGSLGVSADTATDTAGIGGKPARPRADNPRTSSIFVHEIEAGESVEDAIEVINNTETERDILLYAVDSQVASGGSFACAQMADVPVGAGTWIELRQEQVTLGPNSSQEVEFSISVPEGASPGEHNGCLVVQDNQQDVGSGEGGIALRFRSAIRVAVTVPGDITKELDFSGVSYRDAENDLLRLAVGLRNNGNVSLDTDLDVIISSIFGNTVHQVGGEFPVLGGSEAAFNFEVDKPFWGGWYTLQATATYNPDPEQSLGEEGELETISSEKVRFFVRPQPVALLIQAIVVAGLAGVIIWVIARKLHYRKLHARSEKYTVKSGDTLNTIAKKHNVSWQKIAKLNKLKAPYHLESGQRIKVPNKQRSSE